MSLWAALLLGALVALAAVAGLALLARVRRAVRAVPPLPYAPTRAQARWAVARRREADTESTIIIPAGEAGIGCGQWDGMIRRSFPDDRRHRL